MSHSTRDLAAFSALNTPWQSSAREWGIIFGVERKNVSACAGILSQIRLEASVAPFCAGMGYHFRRGMKKCLRLRGKTVPNPPVLLSGSLLRGNGVSFPPGMKNCSRLRGNPWSNPPGMLRGNVLRRNGVSFLPGMLCVNVLRGN